MLQHSSSFLRFRAGKHPQPWPCLTEPGGPETTSGRGTLMTLVVAAVGFLDPSLQLPPDCQVGEVALPRFFFHFIPRQYTDKCKQDTKSLPPLFGPLTQTLVPVSKGGPGGWEPLKHLSDIKTKKLVIDIKLGRTQHLSASHTSQ